MRIEIAWIGPDGPVLRQFELPAPASVADALQRAAQAPEFAGAGPIAATVGVYGRIAPRTATLCEGDRVEIYRGPAVDAKAARRARAGKARGRAPAA